MNVVVTGSSGFIGRHFVDNFSTPFNSIFQYDIAKSRDCRMLFSNMNISVPGYVDVLIHAAANVGGREGIENKQLFIAENFEMDAAMFRWAARAKPKHVVYFSSSAIYPTFMQDKDTVWTLREEAYKGIGEPDSMYGYTKLVGELQAEQLRKVGVNVHVVRPFSGYGEDQSLDYPFPSFIDRAKRHVETFEIWGDGTAKRDWIHVDDIVAAVQVMIDENIPGPVNLGTGRGVSFKELAELVISEEMRNSSSCNICRNWMPDIQYLLDKPQGVHTRVCDPTKLREFYTPKVTLEEGIRRALAV